MMIIITTNNEGLAKQVTVVSLIPFIFLFVILIHASITGNAITPTIATV